MLLQALLLTAAIADEVYHCDGDGREALTAVNGQCVNRWQLDADHTESIIVVKGNTTDLDEKEKDSAAPWTRACNRIDCVEDHVHLMVELSARCAKDLAALDLNVHKVHHLNDHHAMVCTPKEHSGKELDQALLMCDKQDMQHRDVFCNQNMLHLTSPNKKVRDIVKEGFVEAVGEAGDDGKFLNVLDRLSGTKSISLGDKGLFTIRTRYTYTEQNSLSGEYIAQWFTTHGADEVDMQPFVMPNGTPTANIVAVHKGTTKPNEIVVVGAHMDSTSPQGSSLAPGAVDNGSGTVGVMMISQAMSKINFDRTVHLVAFSGEEQGIYGSAHYVAEMKANGLNIVSALTFDMIAYSNKFFGVTIEGTRDAEIQKLMALTRTNLQRYGTDLRVQTADFSFGSDHVSFQRAGIPAILAIELDDTDYHSYHKTTDVVANCNESQAMAIVAGVAGTLYDLANP